MRLCRTLHNENVGELFLRGGPLKLPLFLHQTPMRLCRTLHNENVGELFLRGGPLKLPLFLQQLCRMDGRAGSFVPHASVLYLCRGTACCCASIPDRTTAAGRLLWPITIS